MANIFDWIGMKDEKRALEQVGEHITKVREVVHLLRDGLKASIEGKQEEVGAIHEKLTNAERQADQIRRDLLSSLSEGLLLPPDRDDLVRLAERVDHVADDANGASRILALLDADIPAELADELMTFVELVVNATDRLGDAYATLYRGTVAETLKKCTEVEEFEEEADRCKAKLLRQLFAMDLTAARLLMLHDLIESMENTADRAEDAADVIRNLAVKVKR